MDAAKVIKIGLKTVRAVAKAKFRTRRQKRRDMITMGLIALGVAAVIVGSSYTAVRMDLVPTSKIKRLARQAKRQVMHEAENQETENEAQANALTSNVGL